MCRGEDAVDCSPRRPGGGSERVVLCACARQRLKQGAVAASGAGALPAQSSACVPPPPPPPGAADPPSVTCTCSILTQRRACARARAHGSRLRWVALARNKKKSKETLYGALTRSHMCPPPNTHHRKSWKKSSSLTRLHSLSLSFNKSVTPGENSVPSSNRMRLCQITLAPYRHGEP